MRAQRVIEASAPVRVCDIGGWTDTWFGRPGRVLNLAVGPGAEATVSERPGEGVLLHAADYGDRYLMVPGQDRTALHPLLESAVDALPPPPGRGVEVTVRTHVPAGSSMGTSASVSVALLGALAAWRGEVPGPAEIARLAHRLEVEVLGGESGIQDQICAAHGGISYLEMDRYPEGTVTALPRWDELGPLLALVYLGRAHNSSSVHREVIEGAGRAGAAPLRRLRAAAAEAREAVMSHDLEAFGRAMIDNTEAQAALHPCLVGSDAGAVIRAAEAEGSIGWKVNGAGGEGGSVTILSATAAQRASLERRISGLGRGYTLLPLHLSAEGLKVRCSPPP